jgi:hypothetical protein
MEIDIRGTKISVPDDFLDSALPNKMYFSHSQFAMYRRCPRQYEYRYIKNVKQPPGIAMTQGSAIHKGAEVTHRHTIDHGTPLPVEEAVTSVADTFENLSQGIEEWGDDLPGRVKDTTLNHFRTYYREATPLIKPKAVEYAFASKVGGVPMTGFIDLIDEAQGVEVVSDLKFTGKKWVPQKLRHETQLTLYAHVTGISRVRIDFLLAHKAGAKYEPVRSERTPNDAKILEEDLHTAVDCIKQGVFPRCDPTEWVCNDRFCGYYQQCRGPK